MSVITEHHHLIFWMQDGGDIQEACNACRSMTVLDVIPVEEIIDRDLPVAVDDILLNTIHNFDGAVRHEQAKANAADLTQIIMERWRIRIERREIEAVDMIYLRRLGEAPLRFVKALAVISRHSRNADQV